MVEVLDDDSHSKLTSSGERIEVKYLREKLELIERNKIEKMVPVPVTGSGSVPGLGSGDSRKRQEGPSDLNTDIMNKKQMKTSDRLNTSQHDSVHFSASSSFNGQPVESQRVRSNPSDMRNSHHQAEPTHHQNNQNNQHQNQNNSSYTYTGSDSRSQSRGRSLTANTSTTSSSDTYDVGKYPRAESDKSNHNQRAKNWNSILT